MAVTAVTKNLAARLGYEGYQGVIISDVTSGGPADMAGISEGMLIRSVERRDVTSVDEFREAIEGQSLEKGVMLKIRAGGRNLLMVLKSS